MGASGRGNQIGPPRFAVAVHILVWLARSGCSLSSAAIADQVNSHATFMRRVLSKLAQSGLVEAREGRDGGYSLKKPAERITLADVYTAVSCDGTEQGEQPDCDSAKSSCDGEPGKNETLDHALVEIMDTVDRRTLEYLEGYTIDFLARSL
ncbi:Rrf2 family transcriptional regulator [Cohnella terricola]|uniref:Rrf2 family transcriptional regulator n=1 Tax=Cohnella terricola TaxID=1289167 RepID=A0A559JIJ8_9BACL|nr:Rrf2 family transcriptional regulator [Cohnella terricola]TVX99698.1 Rrf2 family transcriptional regulator [Cohnella terricola]